MSEQPDSKDAGDNTLDEAQVEDVGGRRLHRRRSGQHHQQSLKQAYENLVDFTSHVIERVAIK